MTTERTDMARELDTPQTKCSPTCAGKRRFLAESLTIPPRLASWHCVNA